MKRIKILRIAAIPGSLDWLLKGQLKFLNNYFDVLGVASEGESHKILQDREGIKTTVVKIERNISLKQDLKSVFNLYKLFKKEKPDIIHSVTPKAGLLSMIAGYLANVPIRIHTFTGLIFPYRNGPFRYLLINMDRLTCLFATKIIPEGQGVKSDLIKHRITKKPLNIIANGNVNGIDIDYFKQELVSDEQKIKLKEELEIKHGDFIFSFVGRIVGDKGINELIDSFSKLHLIHNHIKLVLVGDYEAELDPLQDETLRIIKSTKSIIEVGWQTDIRPYLSISDCFVFPSYREGFPNTVLQAGAMCLPSIVTNISGSNEIISNGVNGLIIPSKDKEELSCTMERLIVDEQLRSKLAENARKLIVDKYKNELVWEELLEEYTLQLSLSNPS
ncbi:glycosyltransferase family 4 protein [Saccharicrinis aurantiacus]|uniref:glycosyltransferase family 4 protein n=1 Tax=Saccharicrinis aurantiacus TaxID=1849719 RepID=UPI002492F746|nr:glycosyltransferase family 4 protein [Saccharicrinis aurantiacus]